MNYMIFVKPIPLIYHCNIPKVDNKELTTKLKTFGICICYSTIFARYS